MEFNSNQPIFMQIVDVVVDRILRNELCTGDQVPSVRDLAGQLQVNPNTVMRAFERLTQQELVYNRRGMGYYVAEGARDRALAVRRERLMREVIPALRAELDLLGLSLSDVLTDE